MRIALIASSFDPHIGGVELHVADVARELHRRGHAVEVWAADRGERPAKPFHPDIAVRYLTTPLPARKIGSLLRFAVAAPGSWRTWKRAHREFQPDVLHVHCFAPTGVYATRLHQQTGTPLVVTSHGETTGDDTSVFTRSVLLRQGLTLALAEAAAVTAPTEYVLDDLRARFGLTRGTVVPNGVALDIEPEPATVAGPYIVAVGRLGVQKGFDLLIEAFARARSTPGFSSSMRLVIAGDGPEMSHLRRLVRDLRLDTHVSLVGWQSPAQVAGLLDAAALVVVPSRAEAFGIIALEAWRAGRALIMTSRGGAAEFMTDGTDALLVDPENVEALAATLVRLSNDPALRERLATAGRNRVTEFTWAAVAERYEHVYATAGIPALRTPR